MQSLIESLGNPATTRACELSNEISLLKIDLEEEKFRNRYLEREVSRLQQEIEIINSYRNGSVITADNTDFISMPPTRSFDEITEKRVEDCQQLPLIHPVGNEGKQDHNVLNTNDQICIQQSKPSDKTAKDPDSSDLINIQLLEYGGKHKTNIVTHSIENNILTDSIKTQLLQYREKHKISFKPTNKRRRKQWNGFLRGYNESSNQVQTDNTNRRRPKNFTSRLRVNQGKKWYNCSHPNELNNYGLPTLYDSSQKPDVNSTSGNFERRYHVVPAVPYFYHGFRAKPPPNWIEYLKLVHHITMS